MHAQENYPFSWNIEGDHSTFQPYIEQVPTSAKDSTEAIQVFHQLLETLQNDGYFEASIDQWRFKDTLIQVDLFIGQVYEWLEIDWSGIPPEIRKQSGLAIYEDQNKKVKLQEISQWKQQLLTYAENNGYPFAKIKVALDILANRQTSGRFVLDLGPLIRIDSIQIEGDLVLTDAYLMPYLGIEAGSPYNRKQLLDAERRLKDLPFLQIKEPPAVQFYLNQAYPIFSLDKKRASRFDFIIGVLPNSTQTGNLLVTADLEGEFWNAFGKGERIYAHFEQLRPATQELELSMQYPYFLNLPFGLDFDFHLYKRDSAFLDVETDLGIQYLLEGGNYLKAFWRQENSNLLTIDTDRILATQQLPNQLDIRRAFFGVELLYQQLDYRFNPRSGYSLQLKASAGTKNIEPNNQILELDIGNLYDSLNLRSFQYQIQANLQYFWPLGKRATLKIGNQSSFLFSNEPIFQNEQYRLGGNQLLRGFDEEIFFATHFSVTTLEYRLLLSQNSFLFTFFDGAWFENPLAINTKVNYPYGFGAGISLETSAGLFGLSLAFGRQADTNIDFSQPKVHFGYVSLF